MSTENEDVESEDTEKSSYSLIGRSILFFIIVGPGSLIAFGLWVRIGVGSSITAAVKRGDWTVMLVAAFWLIGMISTARMIFKR